jgi:hypothetical protein
MQYQRPHITVAEYRDVHGQVVRYGHRWEDDDGFRGSPPAWSYSQLGHDDRFDVVVEVAQALTQYLTDNFEIQVSTNGSHTTLTPANHAQSPLTIDADPSRHHVTLNAGYGVEVHFPVCGCQACDEDVLCLIEDLEEQTLAIVNGGLVERLSDRDLSYEITLPDGQCGSRSKIDRYRRKELKSQFTRHERQWEPWTPKSADLV